MAATIVGARATVSIPLNQNILCVMGDMRGDLIEHFMDTDMDEDAATERANEALRIDPAEWDRSMIWLRAELTGAEHAAKVWRTMHEALQLLREGRA